MLTTAHKCVCTYCLYTVQYTTPGLEEVSALVRTDGMQMQITDRLWRSEPRDSNLAASPF